MERQTVRGHHRIMGESDVRQRDGRSRRAGGSASNLVASKLRRPLIRPGTVCRASLIERLARGGPRPVVSVVAPAGYGKTTLLSQWAERDGQAFAWVSVDEADNDAKVLLSYVAEVLDAVEPIDERVFDALASPASSVPGSVVPRLGRAFSSMTSPVVLVLDDVHVLRNSECRAALSVLADHVPAGSRLALAGRAQPPLRIARLRAEGKILEIGPDDLSLTQMEVYAGYSENADHNVGRVIDAIDELGELDNTVIIWIWGDNGASMEGTITGSFNEMTMQNGIPLTDEMQLQLAERYGGIGAWGGQMIGSALLRRVGVGRQHPVPVGQAGRFAPGRDPQPDGRPLAGPDRRGRRAALAVHPRHRRRADDPGRRRNPGPVPGRRRGAGALPRCDFRGLAD